MSYGLFRWSLKTFLFGQGPRAGAVNAGRTAPWAPWRSATCVNCALEAFLLTYLLRILDIIVELLLRI